MAGLWSGHRIASIEHDLFGKPVPTFPDHAHARTSLRGAIRRGALVLMLVTLPACTELAQPSDTMPPGAEPPYVSLAAKYLQSVFKDRASYDAFEISGLRWVHSIKGWSWLTCVHFHDHGHLRSYALFIQENAVVDGRYTVETDACETQTFTQFDVATGVLGRPTAPTQPPLY
jgi:hypothetical protein